MNAPYLKVTVHDNDFTSYYWQVGEAIQNIFKYEGKYSTKEDLDIIKPLIARLWWTIDNLDSYYRWKDTLVEYKPMEFEYFEKSLDLDIVEYTDIPSWNNAEDIYIPLFESDETILLN